MALSRDNLWRNSRDYFFITFGMALYAFGFTAFMLPHKVVIGGLAGVGTLVYFSTGIPVAITQYLCNLALLAVAYRIVGRKFVVGTIYGATMISLWVGLFQPIFERIVAVHGPLVQSPAMSIAVGAIIIGVAIGITFVHNGSSGGTDIVAAMVSKRSNVTIGRTMLCTDFFIISSSYFLFHDLNKVIYGLMVTGIISYVADMVINTNRQAVQFTIISPRWSEIATAINNDAHRGCTVVDAMGWYSKSPVKMLLVVCRKIESVTIFRIVKSVDGNAFITQGKVNGVYGRGFDQMKVKVKPEGQREGDDLSRRIDAAAMGDHGIGGAAEDPFRHAHSARATVEEERMRSGGQPTSRI